MYAIVETGSKQYRIAKGDTIKVELLKKASPGKAIKLDKVLLCSDGKKVEVGKPYLKNVDVNCEVLGNTKAKKIISFKIKRRKGYRKTIGHRQGLTMLKVKEIKAG